MSLLVRKISRAKWPEKNSTIKIDNLQADAVSELRTSKNTLSFWAIDNVSELKNAVVALAVAPLASRLEKIDVIWIDDKDLTQLGIEIEPTKGVTAAIEYADTHRDVCNLTYSSLGIMAKAVMDAIHAGRHERIGKKEVKDYVKEALLNGYIDLNLCKDEMKTELHKL